MEDPLLRQPPIPPDLGAKSSSVAQICSSSLPSSPIDTVMGDAQASSSPSVSVLVLGRSSASNQSGIMGSAPSSFSSSTSAGNSSIPSAPSSSESASQSAPSSSSNLNHQSGFDFNWASRLKSSCKVPISDAPVSISESGRPRVKVPNAVFERGVKLHSDFIVGIFYGRAPSYGKIWGVLNFLWGRDREVTVHNLSANVYLFHIPSASLRAKILQHELWRVGDSPFFVTEWKASYSLDPPSLQRAPIWAKIGNIPFDLVTDEGMGCIAKPLEKVVDVKPFTSVNSAEIKVVVDLTSTLPSSIEIEREDGEVVVLSVFYPWLPPVCDICKEIGHKSNLCPKSKKENLPRKDNFPKAPPEGKNKMYEKGQSSNKVFVPVRNPSQEKVVKVDSSVLEVSAQKVVLDSVRDSSVIGTNSEKVGKDLSSIAEESLVLTSLSEDNKGKTIDGFSQVVKSVLGKRQEKVQSGALVPLVNSFDVLRVEETDIQSAHDLEPVMEQQLVIFNSPASSISIQAGDKRKKRKTFRPSSPVNGDCNPLVQGNVRGLNDETKHRPLANWIYSKPVFFGALLETHVTEQNRDRILSSIGSEWSVFSNYQFSDLGRIWVIFKAPSSARLLFVDLQSVTVEITQESGQKFIFSAVYASNLVEERQELWQSLRDTFCSFGLSSLPWMVCGDFNEILSPSETSNPSISRSSVAMRNFGECLADLGLFDLPFQGPSFTWTNCCSDNPVGKKLDRCLVNGSWLMEFPTSHCSFEAPEFSDHAPCHINLFTKPPNFGTRPFMFYNMIIKHPSFLDSVKKAWVDAGPPASCLSEFGLKLKSLKRPMKTLCKDNFSDIEKRVLEAAGILRHLQLVSLDDPSPVNISLESSARLSWVELRSAEESFFKQRSRVKWMGEGDFNTPFFHKVTKARNAYNAVKFLVREDGSRAESSQEIHNYAVSYFEGVLGAVADPLVSDIGGSLNVLNLLKCSEAHVLSLSAPISHDVIKDALFSMPSSKTPGPDGFPAEFFKASWGIMGQEMVRAIQNFFLFPFMLKATNSTSLVLIQKRPGATELKDFRPISCLNTSYKIVTRILASRFKAILPDIVVPNQTTFIKDRLLIENVLLASEVLNGYHQDSAPSRITLKVDISKAFDSVRWDFLLSVLHLHQFPATVIDSIIACICSPAFSISLNGTTSGFFKGRTGLRQGDPLSPSLFALVMNVLSHMLNKAARDGDFQFHSGCADLELTHLSFADDLLIFLDGSLESLDGVFAVLSRFQAMSGLAVNISKTSMFCSGVSDSVLQEIEARFGLVPQLLPIRYLGLPLCSRRLSVADCDPLLSQIRRKVNSWTHRSLSIAGRYTLISSVISGMISFWSSAFFLPKKVIKRINSLCSAFLWHGNTDTTSGAKVAWDSITCPRKEGGLGLRNIEAWNQTCGLKLIWMLFFRAGSIWVAWIRAKYLSRSTLWALNEKNYQFSWSFRKLLKLRRLAPSFLRIQIGNGDDTFFWWDPWTPFGCLIHYLGMDGPSRLGIPFFSTVKEFFTPLGWALPVARSERQVCLLAFISSITLSLSNDYPTWRIEDNLQSKFVSRKVWDCIRVRMPVVDWENLVWHKARVPKHAFCVWLFVLNPNPTLDRLAGWGYDVEQTCLLCGNHSETRNHLFFVCRFSAEIWKKIVGKLLSSSVCFSWVEIFSWLVSVSPSKDISLALLQAWQACIYEIWRERNRQFHDGTSLPASAIFHKVLGLVRSRAKSLSPQNPDRSSLLQCWL